MELTGDYLIPAPRAAVWLALNEPELMGGCVPGCDEIARIHDRLYEGRVSARIGPMKMRFGGRLILEDVEEPYGYTMGIEAGGGGAGIVKARAEIRLSDANGQTRLTYSAEMVAGGAVAQLAPALVEAEITRLAQIFFQNLSARLDRDARQPAVVIPLRPLPVEKPPAFVPPPPRPVEVRPPVPLIQPAPAPVPAAPVAVAAPVSPPPPRHHGPSLAPSVWIPALIGLVGLLLYAVTRYGA